MDGILGWNLHTRLVHKVAQWRIINDLFSPQETKITFQVHKLKLILT